MEFTIPTSLPTSNSARVPSYEVPEHILPVRIHSTLGNVTSPEYLCSESIQTDISKHCVLSSSLPSDEAASIILDFGVAVAGIPVVQIYSISGSSQPCTVDLSFSENYSGILGPNGDGPFPFSPGADTTRRVRLRISCPGYHEARQVQGSQRWMKITLVSPRPSSITLSLAGFRPTTSNLPLDRLPGWFECSDKTLSQLWLYGARTLQLNCIPERTIPPPWQISEDMGVLIDSQRSNTYAWGGAWTDYEVEFQGMIIQDGLAWTCRVVSTRPGLLLQLNLDEDGSVTIELWYGYYNKPQVTLVPTLLDSQKISDLNLVKKKWYTIKTVCVGVEFISVYVDGVQVATFEQGKIIKQDGTSIDIPTLPRGSAGLGAGQDQVCRFKNFTVTEIPSGSVLYSSGLNNPAVLGDFSLGWNQLPFIFDGAKRDRFAWTADIITGGPALYYSTSGTKYIRGNIEAALLRTEPDEEGNSLLPGGVTAGRNFERQKIDTGIRIMTVNYSLYLIMVIYDYWMYTGDNEFIAKYWRQIQGCFGYIEKLVNVNGLVEAYGVDANDYDYYNGFQTGVATKRNTIYVATCRRAAKMALSPLINDAQFAEQLTSQSNRTAEAIQKYLFNADVNTYYISTERKVGFQQETHSWLITEDIAPASLSGILFDKLRGLYKTSHNKSPISFSPDTPNVPPVISPIMSTFHLIAAIKSGEFTDAEHILRNVWGPMCDEKDPNFTGTTWEFMNADGTPFEGDLCSYAQLFSCGPTSILSKYVLGVEPITPGYKNFSISPRFPITGLDWAQGRVPTPLGMPIEVRWQMLADHWRLDCNAPLGLVGRVVIPSNVWEKAQEITVDGIVRKLNSPEVSIGGKLLDNSIRIVVAF